MGDNITRDVLEQIDVVVFPGESGSKPAAALGDSGREAVREYVRRGGNYIGTCAGPISARYRC